MLRRLFFLLLLIVTAIAALGQMPGVPLNTRSELDPITRTRILLSNYCRLDFDGARLSADGWKRISTYTSMAENPDYKRIAIVSRFNVDVTEEARTEGLHVNYRVVGYYDELGGYTATAMIERAEFDVGEHNDDLLVMGVSPAMPHVSPRAAVAWMNARMGDAKTSDVERTHLKEAVQQLSQYLPQPRPVAAPAAK